MGDKSSDEIELIAKSKLNVRRRNVSSPSHNTADLPKTTVKNGHTPGSKINKHRSTLSELIENQTLDSVIPEYVQNDTDWEGAKSRMKSGRKCKISGVKNSGKKSKKNKDFMKHNDDLMDNLASNSLNGHEMCLIGKSECVENEVIDLVIIDNGEERCYYMNTTDTFEKLHNEACGASLERKLMYLNNPLSKYLTPQEMNLAPKSRIHIVGPRSSSKAENLQVKPLNTYKIKVNVDTHKTVSLEIDKDATLSSLFGMLSDYHGGKKMKLVLNGVELVGANMLSEVLEDNDVVDFV